MEKKVQGSWLIHHTHKLQNVTSQGSYEKTYLAGKAGILLSAISGTNEVVVPVEKLNTLARAANINQTFELPKLLEVLEGRELIDNTEHGVGVLGVTTTSALSHTSDIFDSLDPENTEKSVIEIAEKASLTPVSDKTLGEEISDTFRLSGEQVKYVLHDAEQIGFVDTEVLGKSEKLFFNGNLFRRESSRKIKAVLDSLSAQEQTLLGELMLTPL
ncbi:hypothetical protein [Endozoicomonas montiporae]|uniref:Uncharacterized protein n=2 Tax=Endozoicomonas montiporae TaxID=1027273 RepID=A0A142B874_9GAMM|nr:hypothetical protein [Endozoicomonas montiporae]AMO54950.1 hypothetical protein EZMO1_0715 [Endozoicomonas montiporae CL-33]